MYEISITDGENNGFAIVSADERIAGVLAYIPMITPENELKQRENNLMLELSESSILHRLNYIDSIRTTMRASTLCKLSKKLGISINEIEFEQIKNKVTIYLITPVIIYILKVRKCITYFISICIFACS